LLDSLGVVIDHVEAHASGGVDEKDNLVTACCKCNALKSPLSKKDSQKSANATKLKANTENQSTGTVYLGCL
jgi:hypothetical protein